MANKYVAIAENFFRTLCRNNFHEFAAKVSLQHKVPPISLQCRVVDASEGHVRVEFDVSNEHTNPLGTLHGGCTATLIDTVTTTTLFTTTHNAPGVSIDLSVS
jgi:acyl-coenzyme A thioesterase PaaI-like protein